MPQGNNLEFQRGAAAKAEGIGTTAERIVTMSVTVGPALENLQFFSALWRFEQGQAILHVARHSLKHSAQEAAALLMASLMQAAALALLGPCLVKNSRIRLFHPSNWQLSCCRFRRHRVRCHDGTGGGSWRDASLPASSSLRL
jgi:hypothetical protein